MIKNYKEIATSDLRKEVLDLIEAGLKEVYPPELMKQVVGYSDKMNSLVVQNNTFDIISGRIFVIGGGKAAGLMAEVLEEIIGEEHIEAGVVNCSSDDYKTKKIKIIKASHPIPDKKGVKGVEEMLKLKERYKITKKDLIICLLSGGGSSLMPAPVDGVKLKDKQAATKLLIECGASINDINCVRKHLSKIKGGKLAEYFAPARMIAIIISDVVRNKIDVIASGMTAPDPTTFKDAYGILQTHGLVDQLPESVRAYLEAGINNRAEETPKEIKNCENFIIGDTARALEAMALRAKSLGLRPIILTSKLIGDPEIAATDIAGAIIGGKYKGYDVLLFGGETSPKIPGKHGVGGRNQHFTALMLEKLKALDIDWALAALATDGIDYDKETAGAIIDKESALRVIDDVGEFIARFDSNTLFKNLGSSLIETGYTGTNVGDIVVIRLGK